jgi:hypothetical protein
MGNNNTSPPKEEKIPAIHTRSLIAIIISVIVLALLAYLFFTSKDNSTNKTKKDPNSFIYKKTEEFKVANTGKKDGAVFLKPVAFGAGVKGPVNTSLISLQHIIAVDKKYVEIGGTGINILNATVDKRFTDLFNKAATDSSIPKNPNSPEYQAVLMPIERQISNTSNSKYKVKLTGVTAFKNSNIKANSWKISYTATAPQKDTKNLPAITGEMVFTIGTNHLYYFNIYAVTENWQPNKDIWNKITDGLKIDQ